MNIDLSFLLEKENTPTDVVASFDEKSVSIHGNEFPISINEEFEIENDTFSYNEEEGLNLVEENALLLDDLIVNEVLMNWPVKVLCKEDCKGICPVCGANRNEKDCGCDTVVLDPRMQQFQDVFKDFKEV